MIIEEENTDPNINRRSDINQMNESEQENIFDEDFGKMKMEKFKA